MSYGDQSEHIATAKNVGQITPQEEKGRFLGGVGSTTGYCQD